MHWLQKGDHYGALSSVHFFLVIALILSLTACSAGSRKMTVDVSQLVLINYEGINGYAKPTYELNEHYILEIIDPEDKYSLINLDSIANMKDKDKELACSRLDYLTTLQIAFDEHYDYLKNGDTIRLRFSPNANLAEDAKLELNQTTFETTVSGLMEGTKVDLMKGMQVDFSGYDGEGYAKLKTRGPELPVYYEYKIDKIDNLSNGDTVTIFADYAPEQFGENGYVVTNDTAQLEVRGLKVLKHLTADDLFDDIELVYEGASPKLEFKIQNTMPDNYSDLFSVSTPYKRKGNTMSSTFYAIGEDIEVTLTLDDLWGNALKERGYRLDGKEFTKIYTVPDNLPKYVSDVSEIPEKDRKILLDKAREIIERAVKTKRGYIQTSEHRTFTFYEIDYDGDISDIYLRLYRPTFVDNIIIKDPVINTLLFIGRATLEDRDHGTNDIYITAEISEIIVHPDGTLDYDLEEMFCDNYKINILKDVEERYLTQYLDTYDAIDIPVEAFTD